MVRNLGFMGLCLNSLTPLLDIEHSHVPVETSRCGFTLVTNTSGRPEQKPECSLVQQNSTVQQENDVDHVWNLKSSDSYIREVKSGKIILIVYFI